MSIPRLVLALALSLSVTTGPARAQPAPTVVSVIKAARIIDGSGAPPLDAGAVVVTGDTITWVGKASDLRLPAGARVIDLGRRTLLPGLFDCHVHITGVPGDGGDTQELRETDAHRC
jgi:imidazolonepropionase-like amidohydrolase